MKALYLQNNVNIQLKTTLLIIFFNILLVLQSGLGQDRPPIGVPDTIPPLNQLDQDSLQHASQPSLLSDTLLTGVPDTIPGDSIVGNLNKITFSKDSLDAPVDYSAMDSMIYDIADEKVHLFGHGRSDVAVVPVADLLAATT